MYLASQISLPTLHAKMVIVDDLSLFMCVPMEQSKHPMKTKICIKDMVEQALEYKTKVAF